MSKCPYCYRLLGTWLHDPILLPDGSKYKWNSDTELIEEINIENREYKGIYQVREDEIIELQDTLKILEAEMILEIDRTIFSPLNTSGKFQITGKHIKEMRDSIEKIINILGLTKEYYFNYDEEGNHIIHPKGDKTDWADPIIESTDLEKFQIKNIHIEDLRHYIPNVFWIETFDNDGSNLSKPIFADSWVSGDISQGNTNWCRGKIHNFSQQNLYGIHSWTDSIESPYDAGVNATVSNTTGGGGSSIVQSNSKINFDMACYCTLQAIWSEAGIGLKTPLVTDCNFSTDNQSIMKKVKIILEGIEWYGGEAGIGFTINVTYKPTPSSSPQIQSYPITFSTGIPAQYDSAYVTMPGYIWEGGFYMYYIRRVDSLGTQGFWNPGNPDFQFFSWQIGRPPYHFPLVIGNSNYKVIDLIAEIPRWYADHWYLGIFDYPKINYNYDDPIANNYVIGLSISEVRLEIVNSWIYKSWTTSPWFWHVPTDLSGANTHFAVDTIKIGL